MRIVLENSGYELLNLGDVAMLQVAVARLRELWPDAEIHVPTISPEALQRYCPGTIPLDPKGRAMWLGDTGMLGPIGARAPAWIRRQLFRLARARRRRHPARQRAAVTRRFARRGLDVEPMAKFLDAVLQADLIMGAGGGYLTDSFAEHAINAMETLMIGISMGIPTALMGQGIGPLTQRRLLRPAGRVLPRLDLIALREDRQSRSLLRGMGVGADRIITTGDDAIEIATGDDVSMDFSGMNAPAHQGIGVNLRTAWYADVPQGAMAQIREVLREAGARYHSAPVALPVSRHDGGEDARAIAQLLEGLPEAAQGGAIETPAELIAAVARCRVVLTGSYHAGVFALARGIPTVALARSGYYLDKFAGLAAQFGATTSAAAGCELVPLDAADFQQRLSAALDRAWQAAGTLAPALQEAARKQVRQGRLAYARLGEIVRRRRGPECDRRISRRSDEHIADHLGAHADL